MSHSFQIGYILLIFLHLFKALVRHSESKKVSLLGGLCTLQFGVPSAVTLTHTLIYLWHWTWFSPFNVSTRLSRTTYTRRKYLWVPKEQRIFTDSNLSWSRSQWLRVLRRGSAAVRLLWLRVRTPPEVWTSVCSECCVLSGGGLCVGLITRPEESYRVWVSECEREASIMRRPWPTTGLSRHWGKKNISWKIIDFKYGLPICV
jgi:hypothetical protein